MKLKAVTDVELAGKTHTLHLDMNSMSLLEKETGLNLMQGTSDFFQELNITKNPSLEMDGLNSRGVRFYSHVIFMDTFFSVDSI